MGSLQQLGARDYSPILGRLISADTIVPGPGNPQNLNRYAYGLGNPLRYTDPSGHYSCEDDCDAKSKPQCCVTTPSPKQPDLIKEPPVEKLPNNFDEPPAERGPVCCTTHAPPRDQDRPTTIGIPGGPVIVIMTSASGSPNNGRDKDGNLLPIGKTRKNPNTIDMPDQQSALDELVQRARGILVDIIPVHHDPNGTRKGPNGEPYEQIYVLDVDGKEQYFDHDLHGHTFNDGPYPHYEPPHYHGPNKEHIYYPGGPTG